MGTKFSKSYFTRVHSLVEGFVTLSFPENEGEMRSRYLKKKISSAVKEKKTKKLALDYDKLLFCCWSNYLKKIIKT